MAEHPDLVETYRRRGRARGRHTGGSEVHGRGGVSPHRGPRPEGTRRGGEVHPCGGRRGGHRPARHLQPGQAAVAAGRRQPLLSHLGVVDAEGLLPGRCGGGEVRPGNRHRCLRWPGDTRALHRSHDAGSDRDATLCRCHGAGNYLAVAQQRILAKPFLHDRAIRARTS